MNMEKADFSDLGVTVKYIFLMIMIRKYAIVEKMKLKKNIFRIFNFRTRI